MESRSWKWVLGLVYIVAVATIWIAASFIVQSAEDSGVSPFIITYICNSLFIIYIPLVEIARFLEDWFSDLLSWNGKVIIPLQELEQDSLLCESVSVEKSVVSNPSILEWKGNMGGGESCHINFESDKGVDSKGRWTRGRVAKISLLICPFWFLAQLAFNLSLKYTTVTSNTILSSSSSLFTFLISLAFLDERFTWLKLTSVLLCMSGTIVVSVGDSRPGLHATAPHPLLGDILSLLSAVLYAVYITLIRLKIPADNGKDGHVSMAQFLGFLGLFNLLIFSPVAIALKFTYTKALGTLSFKQFSLLVGKGLLDNVLSDYLWAKAVLLTSATVATAGLTIQVPLAAIVDTVTGKSPRITDYLGALAVIFGFVGINIQADAFDRLPCMNDQSPHAAETATT